MSGLVHLTAHAGVRTIGWRRIAREIDVLKPAGRNHGQGVRPWPREGCALLHHVRSDGLQGVPGHAYVRSDHGKLSAGLRQAVDETIIHGVHYAALRYFNAAGATAERGEDHAPELHLIPLVLQVALGQREKIMVFGENYPTLDGTCVRGC